MRTDPGVGSAPDVPSIAATDGGRPTGPIAGVLGSSPGRKRRRSGAASIVIGPHRHPDVVRWVGVVCVTALLSVTSFIAGARRDATAASQPIVHTASGPVRGLAADGVRRFLGIPYAAPPVGPLRWRAPRPVHPWTAPRAATTAPPACVQPPGVPGTASEDCLYLNITAPDRPAAGRPRPVMVWLHGGGNFQGAAAAFDPLRMAVDGDVVVVTVGYRLGVFGFFGYPGLPGSGTYGLQDQQAALRWVRRNAAAFGGDPRNVTLFGESAGGIDTCAQLTSPGAAGLFDRAILQSGSCSFQNWMISYGHTTPAPSAGSAWRPVRRVQADGADAAATLGCLAGPGALDCLRRVPADRLRDRTTGFSLPAFGTATLPHDPARAIADGAFQHVPVLSGNTQDESRFVTAYAELPDRKITRDRFDTLIDQAFGDRAAAVRRHYPLSAYESPAVAWAAVDTDRDMVCPQLRDGRAMAGRIPLYSYEFADRQAPPIAPFPPGSMPPGASHGSELAYLFDVAGEPIDWNGDPVPLTPAQWRLAATMIGYWTRFARTGDPNGGSAPSWPSFRPYGTASISQALAPGRDGIVPVALGREHQCAFWDRLDRRTA
ncbi:carboxylesterase/lipase family protein [Actinoallomurus soli]|uniref:carboxylesterase/lipase family protein n=1 Tax=Actinoallomurus soli TaxID=2952535 RepID=UPI0020924B12|nr:carboxylesterase family protein [Actinoallomurus soli]MCO5974109.1 carboxylesterase family protein [Actinoallomurus soli]